MLTGHPRRAARAAAAVAALAAVAAIVPSPAHATFTRTKTGTCKAGLLFSTFSATVTWEISDLIVNARAVKTAWKTPSGLGAVKIVTDEAFAGVLVTGGRHTWTGPETQVGSTSYALPWWTISNGRGRLDANVGFWTISGKACSVRIAVPV